MLLLCWPLAAFGGSHATTAIPHAIACIAYACLMRVRLRRGLDAALGAVLACMALQIVPLPAGAVDLLSPHAAAVRARLALGTAPPLHRPISIRPLETAWALMVMAGAVSMFWIARTTFDRGGVRRMVRGLCAAGLGVSILAIVQTATGARSVYWSFGTHAAGLGPLGPFVNRNHFAAWVVMVLPLCVGYIATRPPEAAAATSIAFESRDGTSVLVDARGAWLTVAACLMLLGAGLSLSRAGVLGLVAGAALTLVLVRRTMNRKAGLIVAAAAAALVTFSIGSADVPAIATRIGGLPAGAANRLLIWRETAPIVRDFAGTGTGAGTFESSMRVYQQSERSVYFNQAHNHYLQVAAEGGLLLGVPVLVALALFVRAAVRAFRHDDTSVFYVRAGAACGLAAVALQSLWETALVMPANAVLAATLAAIVVHERGQ